MPAADAYATTDRSALRVRGGRIEPSNPERLRPAGRTNSAYVTRLATLGNNRIGLSRLGHRRNGGGSEPLLASHDNRRKHVCPEVRLLGAASRRL